MTYRRGWIAALLFALAMLNYIDRVTLSFAGDEISREYGLTPVALGYLMSSFLWTYTIFSIPMGMLVDSYGARRVASFGLGIWSVATALTGLAGSFGTIMATRLTMGAGEAVSNPAGASVIRAWIPTRERGVATAIFNSGSYAGPALCALCAGPIIEALGWHALFYIAGGLGLVWLTIWLLCYEAPEKARWLPVAELATILAERCNGARAAPDAAKIGLPALLGSSPTLWGIALTQGCNVYCQYLFLTWFPSYLHNTQGLTLAKTGLFAAIPYAMAVVLCLVVGRISDRMINGDVGAGRRRYAIACTMVLAAVVLFAPYLYNIWAIDLLVGLSLAGVASTTALNFALLNDLLPSPADVGSAMAFVVVGGNLFGLLAPIVTGYIIAATGGYGGAFLTAGVLLLIGALSTLTLTRRPMRDSASPNRGHAHA